MLGHEPRPKKHLQFKRQLEGCGSITPLGARSTASARRLDTLCGELATSLTLPATLAVRHAGPATTLIARYGRENLLTRCAARSSLAPPSMGSAVVPDLPLPTLLDLQYRYAPIDTCRRAQNGLTAWVFAVSKLAEDASLENMQLVAAARSLATGVFDGLARGRARPASPRLGTRTARNALHEARRNGSLQVRHAHERSPESCRDRCQSLPK